MSHPNLLTYERILPFITAGKAIFTAKGKETRFTYKVWQPKNLRKQGMAWVYVLTGPDNTSARCYTYVGYLRDRFGRWEYKHSKSSRIGFDTQSLRAFRYVIGRIVAGVPLDPAVEVWHEGRCAKCGAPLTVPESIQTGFGPICIKTLHH